MPPTNETFKEKSKRKAAGWGQTGMTKSITWSDKIGTKVNGWAEGYGFGERFWPVSGDYEKELDKCYRILSGSSITLVSSLMCQVEINERYLASPVVKQLSLWTESESK